MARADRPILLYSPMTEGGICEYVHAQANELAARGLRPVLLAAPAFLARHPRPRYDARGVLLTVPSGVRGRWRRRALHALVATLNPWILALHVLRLRPRLVVLDAMNELLAPLWFGPHWLFARLGGVTYAAALHDPLREAVGPGWWHRLSLRAAYAPLSIGLSHDLAVARRAGVPDHVRLVEVPHGVFPAAAAAEEAPTDSRAALGIAAAAPVALAFGFVSDRKNLDLAIDALAQVPELHLIVAGRRGSSQDRPVGFYRDRAGERGVAERCHFIDRYLADEELPGLFAAADFLLLAYTRSFVSQSGVLHIAANWNKPVLAAGGEGPLLKAVRSHALGLIIEPDSVSALADGFRAMMRRVGDPEADRGHWDSFRREASWGGNIDALLGAVDAARR